MHSSRKGLTVEETIAELYSDPFSNVSDLESSNVETVVSAWPTTSVRKRSQSLSGDSSDSEHSSIDIDECEISEQSDIETVDGWSKHHKTPNLEPFLGNQSVAIDDPSDITQVLWSFSGKQPCQIIKMHGRFEEYYVPHLQGARWWLTAG
jgi:hypothetical protein